jgi:hypothetical protein
VPPERGVNATTPFDRRPCYLYAEFNGLRVALRFGKASMEAPETEQTPEVDTTCIIKPADTCNREAILAEYSPLAVYMNLPYIEAYVEMELAIWTTVYMHGLRPRLVRELRTHEPRLCRIFHLLQACEYGISDFTYDRMNVAFEHGLLKARHKKVLELIDERHRLPKDLSDLMAEDPIGHDNDSEKLIIDLTDNIERNWKAPSGKVNKRHIMAVHAAVYTLFKQQYTYRKINLFYEELPDLMESIVTSAQQRTRRGVSRTS